MAKLNHKYSKYKKTHSQFFTLFNQKIFFSSFDAETDNVSNKLLNIKKAFRYNLESIISMLSFPIIISKTRSKMHIYDKIYSAERILNAPFPEDLYDSKEEYIKAEENGLLKAKEIAEQKYYESLQSEKGGIRFWDISFQFLEDCLNFNNDLGIAAKALLKQSTVLLWSSFEVLFRDFIIVILNNNPQKIKDFDFKNIDIYTLDKYNFNIKTHVGNIYAEKHDWSNLYNITNCFKKLFPQNKDINLALKDSDLWKLNQRRHLIVHNSGIIDKQYKNSTVDKFKIGNEITINPLDLKKQVELVKSMGIRILNIKE